MRVGCCHVHGYQRSVALNAQATITRRQLRPCLLLRQLAGCFEPFGQAGSGDGAPRRFKYYVAIDQDTVADMEAMPLVHILQRNDVSGKLSDLQDSSFPFCSCPDLAMLLGFFAYNVHTLNLVQLEATGLLSDQRPHEHPLGGFWFLPPDTLKELVGKGTVQVSYAPCILDLQGTATWQASTTILRHAQQKYAAAQLNMAKDSLRRLQAEAALKEAEVKELQDVLDDCMGKTARSQDADI